MIHIIRNVRLSYVYLHQPQRGKNDDGTLNPAKDYYSVNSILDKKVHAKEIEAIQKTIADLKKNDPKLKGKIITKTGLRDGTERKKIDAEGNEVYAEGYGPGVMFIPSNNRGAMNRPAKKPFLVDLSGQQIPAGETKFYSGCYANVKLDFYAYRRPDACGITSSIVTVQFLRDGEPLGEANIDPMAGMDRTDPMAESGDESL